MQRGNIELGFRLLPGVNADIEWEFLLHESYVGERCGVGLLRSLVDRVGTGTAFGRMLERHLADEESHARTYEGWLGTQPYRGARYDEDLAAYVTSLESVTLQIFVIQALLEGFSLGALEYRARVAPGTHTAEREKELLADELRHVQFAYGYMGRLVTEEGAVAPETFDEVAEHVKGIFAASFDPARIAAFVEDKYTGAPDDLATEIANSAGRSKLAWATLGRVGRHKRDFTRRYAAAAALSSH